MDFPFFGPHYQVQELLSDHGYTRIYAGYCETPDAPVIFKCLNLSTLPDWSIIQHLEYEAELLQRFEHPRIPRLLERKELMHDNARYLCLIQQRLPGENLQTVVKQRLHLTWPETLHILGQVLQILKALQGFHPQIMHLDIKPSNLMYVPSAEEAYGTLSLIDFGAARIQGQETDAAGGTPGFSPPEQLQGRPVPASDLYALGATALELLTGSAAENLYNGNRLEFWDVLEIPAPYKNWLEIMVHPDASLRFDHAEQALEQLLQTVQTQNPEWMEALQQQLLRIPDVLKPTDAQVSAVGGLLPQERERPTLAGYRFKACKSAPLQSAIETWTAERMTTERMQGTSGEAPPAAEPVIIKKPTLSALQNWKELTQFEREIENLSQLEQTAFPRLLAVKKEAEAWYLVQSCLPGESLQEKVEGGWRPDTLELCRWMLSVLETLRILHRQTPPLVHRDLQPEHLLLDGDRTYLLGFGGAQQRLALQGSGGSTQTGSFGYTAPEQYMGLHSPRSDIFSLGMCALYVLRHRSPASYRWENQMLDLRDLQIPEGLKGWLKRVTHLDPDRRHSSAEDAYAALKHQYEALYTASTRLSTAEKQQARLEDLRRSESSYAQQQRRFQQGEEPQEWRENLWIQALKTAEQPLPPSLRVDLQGMPASVRHGGAAVVKFMGPSPSREPLVKRAQLVAKVLMFIGILPAILGFILAQPLAFVPLVLGALFWLRNHLVLSPFLCDFSLEMTADTLQMQKTINAKWSQTSNAPPRQLPLPTAGQLEVLPVDPPLLLKQNYYVLVHDQQVISAPFFLLEKERDWLAMILPFLVQKVQPDAADLNKL